MRGFSCYDDNWAEAIAAFLMDFGPGLFLTLTEDSNYTVVRFFGCLLTAVWFFPAIALVMLPVAFFSVIGLMLEESSKN